MAWPVLRPLCAHGPRPAPAAGKFARDCCPAYLREANFARLKGGAIDSLHIVNGFFLDALNARKYSKVRRRCAVLRRAASGRAGGQASGQTAYTCCCQSVAL